MIKLIPHLVSVFKPLLARLPWHSGADFDHSVAAGQNIAPEEKSIVLT
jgi:hypothetical protein